MSLILLIDIDDFIYFNIQSVELIDFFITRTHTYIKYSTINKNIVFDLHGFLVCYVDKKEGKIKHTETSINVLGFFWWH